MLLEKVYREAGHDFRDYKHGTVTRRLERRLHATGAMTYPDYMRFLDTDPAEYQRLAEDLIIMDIQLPGMNGLEVTRKLRETPAFTNTPIIAITAYAMKGDRDKVIESGCDAYLSKPINTRELPGMVAEILSQRQEENPLP
ncbi:response regulator [Chloroflexota bacterium]